MAVAAGFGYTLEVIEDGNLCSFGDNQNGQLGVGDFHAHLEPCVLNYIDTVGGHEVVMVAGASSFCVCVTKDGSLWKWGMNMGWMQDEGDNDDEPYR